MFRQNSQFCQTRRLPPDTSSVMIDRSIINPVTVLRDFGLLIDSALSMFLSTTLSTFRARQLGCDTTGGMLWYSEAYSLQSE